MPSGLGCSMNWKRVADMRCQERAGFLFDHPCESEAQSECARCQREICKVHVRSVEKEQLCTSCARKILQKRGPSRTTRRRGMRASDPYFYGTYHYQGYRSYRRGRWGHSHYQEHIDGSDFTEADGESFETEGDDGWETDMGGS